MTEKNTKEQFIERVRNAVEEIKDQEFLIKIPLGEEGENETEGEHDRGTV